MCPGGKVICSASEEGSNNVNGVSNYQRNSKYANSAIVVGINLENYTIIIEENIDSIPEFPSWIIIPIFLTITLTSVIFRKKIRK